MRRTIKTVCLLAMVLLLLATTTAWAEKFDVNAYSYEELLTVRDQAAERIAEMERQYAIENGNRKISFDKEQLLILDGRTAQLNPDVKRIVEEAPQKTAFAYVSSNPEVAKVSTTGLVTAVSVGETVITCSAKDDELIFCDLPVQVIEPVASLSMDQNAVSLLLKNGQPAAAQVNLNVTVEPENAFYRKVLWSSSDETVATVDENGHVCAVAPGSATITALSEEEPAKGKKTKSVSCKVTVGQAVEKISFTESTSLMAAGSTFNLKADVQPENATLKNVEWESSNPEILSISAKGVMSGKSCGTVKVICRATDGSGVETQCNVQVYQRVTGISLNSAQNALLLTEKDEDLAVTQLAVIIEPENAMNQKVVWASSDETVATVDETGCVRALAPGNVTITATSTDDPGKDQNGKQKKPYSASCKISVGRAVNEILLDKNDLLMSKGKKTTLTATVLPEDATKKSYTWESSEPDVVSVTTQGQLTAKSCGTARITCTANDGSGELAVCEVKVIQMVNGLKIDAANVGITKGKSRQLTATVSPSDATNSLLSWSSSDTGIVSVDQSGNITTHKKGSAVITACTTDGSEISSDVKVTVEPVNSVSIERIGWKAYLGVVKNKLSVEATNNNAVRTVKGFDFTVKCTDSSGYSSTNYLSWQGKQIRPGQALDDAYQSGLSGFGYARQLEITITTIYFTDGTSETIPYDERYTSTFRF